MNSRFINARYVRLASLTMFAMTFLFFFQNCVENKADFSSASSTVMSNTQDDRPYDGKVYSLSDVACADGDVTARIEYRSSASSLLLRYDCMALNPPQAIPATDLSVDPTGASLIYKSRVYLPETPGYQASSQVPRVCDLTAYSTVDHTAANRVQYLYCLVLGRAPVGAEADPYINFLQNGSTTVPAIALSMLSSSEYVGIQHSVAKLDDPDFVALTYRTLLTRDPGSLELKSSVSSLATGAMTRNTWLQSFANSTAFQSAQPWLFQ